MQKGFSAIIVLVALIALVIVGGGIFYVSRLSAPKIEPQQSNLKLESTSTPTTNPELQSTSPTQQDETTSWKTYTNTKYGYTIKYPSDWTAGDGWFTAPGGQPGYGYSDVSIQVLSKAINLDNANREKDTLEEYVKKDAGGETGPSRTPISIKKITTQSGNIGFSVEWEASGWSANKKTYTTFFELPNDKTSTLQIAGMEGHHLDIYNLMVPTFKLTQ